MQSSHCEQLCFLLLGWQPPTDGMETKIHPRSNSNIQLLSLWSARKLSMHSLIRIHHWVKLLSGALTPQHYKQRERPDRCWQEDSMVCAGLVSAQASGTGTDTFCYTMDSSSLDSSLWHSAVHLLMPSFTVLDTDLLLLHSEEIASF